jgi:hypothetical protein
MENTLPKQRVNPLASLMRQPKISIKLPSKGRFWADGSLDMSPNSEYAVYSMTARDELLLKTPDALMNGQAVVDVIQNCVPAIKNAWEIPSIDLDVVLIAIRLATYGEMMETSITIGEEEMNYNVDLRQLLDTLYETITWEERINVGTELALYIKPVNYHTISKTSIQNFETQKLMNLVNNSELSEEQKVDTFRDSFKKLTDITVGIINNSVYRIESSAGTTEIPEDIDEFMENCDKSVYDAVKDRLDSLRKTNSLKPVKVRATQEMIDNGSEEELEVPLTFDPANFFE